MVDTLRYGKPNMANLPPELGRAIIRQIMGTPAPDRKKRKEEADRLEQMMAEELKRHKNE